MAPLACSFGREGTDPAGLPPLRIAFYTDVHSRPDMGVPAALEKLSSALREVEADVLICGGDVIDGGHRRAEALCQPYFDVYTEFLKSLNRPVEHVIGNHDLAGAAPEDGSPAAQDPRALFRKNLGISQTTRSFDLKGYHFILLDSVEVVGGKSIYRGWVDLKQMEWLRADLEKVPGGTPIILATHIPLRSVFLQVKGDPLKAADPNLLVANANEVLSLFADRPLPLVLQAHLHSDERIDWCGRAFVMGGAVAAGWWKGPNLQTGYGYQVIEIRDGRIHTEYRSYGWPVAG